MHLYDTTQLYSHSACEAYCPLEPDIGIHPPSVQFHEVPHFGRHSSIVAYTSGPTEDPVSCMQSPLTHFTNLQPASHSSNVLY